MGGEHPFAVRFGVVGFSCGSERQIQSLLVRPWSVAGKAEAVSARKLLVRTGRVELPWPFGRQILSLVRLPVPPRAHTWLPVG